MSSDFKYTEFGESRFGDRIYRVLLSEREGFSPQIHINVARLSGREFIDEPRRKVVFRIKTAGEIASSILNALDWLNERDAISSNEEDASKLAAVQS